MCRHQIIPLLSGYSVGDLNCRLVVRVSCEPRWFKSSFILFHRSLTFLSSHLPDELINFIYELNAFLDVMAFVMMEQVMLVWVCQLGGACIFLDRDSCPLSLISIKIYIIGAFRRVYMANRHSGECKHRL